MHNSGLKSPTILIKQDENTGRIQSNPAVPRLSFATRFAHFFAHIFATGNEIQKYFSARSNSFDLTENSVKAVLTWMRT